MSKPEVNDGTLRNVQRIYDQLRSSPQLVVINATQAREIWRRFQNTEITDEKVSGINARAFLQAAMMGAIEASQSMGYLKRLMSSALVPNATLTGILKALLQEKLKQVYHQRFMGKVELYSTPLKFIAYGNKHYFTEISQGLIDDPSYL